MKTWVEPGEISVSEALREAVGGHRVVAERLARRGVVSPADARCFLSQAAYTPAPPDDLPDMARAVEVVQRAIRGGGHILVWGDFDVDGQTATALLVNALRDLGADVSYHIPNRFDEGHGIHVPTLKTLLDGVDLLLTCDTGVSAHEAVRLAHSHMVDVVITDHHTLPETLPDAEAVVNPQRLPPGHALRELPGVGVAYQLARALYGERNSDHLLDLLAVGIVADVMVLVDDTRYWLQRGLAVLRESPRPGLRAILERAEINPADVSESDIGFTLAPRLNALGRLADANPAVELLTTGDPAVIAERVNELEGLNQKRRFLTRQVYEAAQQKIADDPALLKYAALVISGEGWHSGVLGIVASRLAGEYACPTVILTENDGIASGSARSVAGCDIIAAISGQAALLRTFGGHNMAAGLSLPAENLFDFRRGLSGAVRETLGKVEIEPQLALDGYLSLKDITLDFAEDISRLAPFGNGNPPLTLATRNVRVKSRRTLGSRGDHLSLKVMDEAGNEQRVIWWFGDIDAVPEGPFDLAYTVRANVFNGKREALIEWLDARAVDGGALVLGGAKAAYTVVDHRQNPDPATLLNQLKNEHPDVLVWREAANGLDGVDRFHLHTARTLAVWTTPADVFIWEAALDVVQPDTLILFGQPTPFETPQALLTQVGGLLKYALQDKGARVSVSELAALTAQTEVVIHACLRWFNGNSELQATPLTDDVYQLENVPHTGKDTRPLERLQALLKETNAYRRFWRKQDFG